MFIKKLFNQKIQKGDNRLILNCLFNSEQVGMNLSIQEVSEIYNLCLIEDTDNGIPINIFNQNIIEEIMNTEYEYNTTKGKLKKIITYGLVKSEID